MKRLILVLMLFLLPLQASMAAAGAYCQHEQGAATQHFGHHAHQHQGADKDSPAGGSAASFHADCAFCHLGCVGAVTSSLDVASSAPPAPAAPPDNNFLLVFLDGPERPKWASAA